MSGLYFFVTEFTYFVTEMEIGLQNWDELDFF